MSWVCSTPKGASRSSPEGRNLIKIQTWRKKNQINSIEIKFRLALDKDARTWLHKTKDIRAGA